MMGSVQGIRDRIKKFTIEVIKFARNIPHDEVGRVFVNQIIRSSTSIGANYEEGSEAQTNKDLIYKLFVVKKEAKETRYWLDLICDTYPELSERGKLLIGENYELIKIISSIISKKRLES